MVELTDELTTESQREVLRGVEQMARKHQNLGNMGENMYLGVFVEDPGTGSYLGGCFFWNALLYSHFLDSFRASTCQHEYERHHSQ